jgi:metal transporter CNNM
MCSVICMESLPIVLQSVMGSGWMSVVCSTVAITLLAELLPQYVIPRQPLRWGYYSWPVIWGCMWLTSLISWPISMLLDKMAPPKENRDIYTNDQLSVLMKFHERAEKHGGDLGPDAGRIIRGALEMDGRTIGTAYRHLLGKSRSGGHQQFDVEKGYYGKPTVIIPWSAVRYVDINEEVNADFITKVRNWSYIRIPVIGTLGRGTKRIEVSWDGWCIFGFLHIKVCYLIHPRSLLWRFH